MRALLDSPLPFERGLGDVSHRDHLLSRAHPHDGTVVALTGTHLLQAGEAPPRKRQLQTDETGDTMRLRGLRMGATALHRQEMPEDVCLLIVSAPTLAFSRSV